MSRQTKENIQTNILYDYYRFCNGQESCFDCPLYNLIINFSDNEIYYDPWEEQERRDREYYGIDDPLIKTEETTEKQFKEEIEIEDWMIDDGFDMYLEELEKEKYKCLRNFSKHELECAVKEIEEWCEENSEYYLKDCLITGNRHKRTYPDKCPLDYSFMKENGTLTDEVKNSKLGWYLDEVMNPIKCNREKKGYDKNCKECKTCWDTPMRYEDMQTIRQNNKHK